MENKSKRIMVSRGVDVNFVTILDKEILDDASIKDLEQEIGAVMADGERPNLLVDFSNVKFMSSAFLGLLVKIHKRVREDGGEIKLSNVHPNIYRVFEITRLDKVFDIS